MTALPASPVPTRVYGWNFCLVALLAIAGCATPDNPPDLGARYRAQVKACRAGYGDAALNPIRNKFPALTGRERPTPEMLSDSSKPTDEQRSLILVYDKRVIECANGYTPIFADFGPEYLAVHVQATTRAQADRVDLYQGKLTFGEYVRKVTALTDEARARFAVLNRGAAGGSVPVSQPTTFQPMQVPPVRSDPKL